jgi:hypothetical protein
MQNGMQQHSQSPKTPMATQDIQAQLLGDFSVVVVTTALQCGQVILIDSGP